MIATLFTQPRTLWQGEEVQFAQSLLTFDPPRLQPEPPAYEVEVVLGRLLNFFVHDPFRTLAVLSVIAAVAGAVVTALAASRILGDERLGAAAAMFLYGSPAMLVFAPLPAADAVAIALVAAALWLFVDRQRIAAAVVMAAALVPFYATVHRADGPRDDLVRRFLAHPWGFKYLSYPLLILAAAGVVVLVRRARMSAAVLIAFAAIHLGVCLAFADRTHGVEPVIPSMIVFAIFAAAALSRWPAVALAVSIVYAAGSFAWAWPLLNLRHTTPSPPARATHYVRQFVPDNAILVCDPAMEPWGRLTRFEVHSLADFDAFAFRGDVPLFMLADGGSRVPHAAQFSWPESDVYGKVTTRRGRVVSVIPFPAPMRYRSLSGVYAFERTPEGEEWRWLAGDAAISLPPLGDRVVHLRLGLPADAPVASNTVAVNGTSVTVGRGQTLDVAFAAAPLLRFHAARTFATGDRRDLAVQLIALEQR